MDALPHTIERAYIAHKARRKPSLSMYRFIIGERGHFRSRSPRYSENIPVSPQTGLQVACSKAYSDEEPPASPPLFAFAPSAVPSEPAVPAEPAVPFSSCHFCSTAAKSTVTSYTPSL